jgi:hypothetical protein
MCVFHFRFLIRLMRKWQRYKHGEEEEEEEEEEAAAAAAEEEEVVEEEGEGEEGEEEEEGLRTSTRPTKIST